MLFLKTLNIHFIKSISLLFQKYLFVFLCFSLLSTANAEIDLTQHGYANPLSNFVNLTATGRFLQNPDTGYKYGKHLGMDYDASAEDIIYSICDGTVVESKDYNFHRTYNTTIRDEYNSYWTSRVVVRCASPSFLVIYGHVDGALNENDSVQKGAYIAKLAPAHSIDNARQPSRDHLHFGINVRNGIDYSDSSLGSWGFGIGPKDTSNESVANRGFRHPIEFLTEGNNADVVCIFPDIEYSDLKIAVKKLCEKGIIKGYGDGNFGPNDNIQRAQLAKMVVLTKLRNEKMTSTEKESRPQPDLTLEEDYSGELWEAFQDDINARRERKIPEKTFCDSGKSYIAPPSTCNPKLGHASSGSTTNWFCEYVNTLANIGLVTGYGAGCGFIFKPFQTISRAEAIIMILKGIVGVDIKNEDRDWFTPVVKCALDTNASYNNQTYRLFRLSEEEFNSIRTSDAKLIEFGITAATRAEIAFLIHRIRELRGDGHPICSTYGTVTPIN